MATVVLPTKERGPAPVALAKSALERRYPWVLGISLVLLIPLLVISVGLGSTWIPPGRVLAAVFDPSANVTDHVIIVQLRMPRALIALVAGAMLAGAGALLQVVTRNPLAEPSLTGITAGSVAAIAFWISYVPITTAASVPLPLVGLGGGLTTVVLMYFLSWRRGQGADPTRLILTGLVLDAMFGAFTSFALVLNGDDLSSMLYYLIGSLEGSSWESWNRIWPWALVGIVAMLLLAGVCNVLNLGDDVSSALGQRPSRARAVVLGVAAILTAGAVAVVGAVAFIGLIGPHIARRLVGGDARRLFPVSLVVGALILGTANVLSQALNVGLIVHSSARTFGLPVGALTAVVGAGFFFYLLWKRAR